MRFFYYRRLALVLILAALLAGTYSVIVPIGRGADEWAHYWYARFIAEHGRLPANAAEREVAGYKSDWPPLYHLLAAGMTAWVNTAGPPTFKYRADNLRRQLVSAQGPEAILHTEDELFPWRQEILIWHLGRFLSIGFSLITLLFTYVIALDVFTVLTGSSDTTDPPASIRSGSKLVPLDPRWLAIVSVAGLAFIPRFLFTGMLFSYDSLTLLLASLFLWILLRVTRGYYGRWGFWLLGGVAGLALVTKYLAALLPLEILVVAWFWPPRKLRPASTGRWVLAPVFVRLAQAALAFLLVVSWWFGYLLINFNEIEAYGPVLGTAAPLLRGDGSDRTVEQIFAFFSGGKVHPPAHIDTQSYTPWRIMTEFPATLWAIPTGSAASVTWFIIVMSVLALGAIAGLIIWWPVSPSRRSYLKLLLFHCALPWPFMIIRLFGARDALEAVQGRHLLFLAGPALVILLVWGLYSLTQRLRTLHLVLRAPLLTVFIALLLVGAMDQLIALGYGYPPLLPVQTTSYRPEAQDRLPPAVVLPGGARLIAYRVTLVGPGRWPPFGSGSEALKVTFVWQAGAEPAAQDYRVEVALVDAQGQAQAGWLAYQTQARYPTRVWEVDDVVRDESWLPLNGVSSGDYQIRWRILGEKDTLMDWQTLSTYSLSDTTGQVADKGPAAAQANWPGWLLWRQGEVVSRPPLLTERETAQFSLRTPASPSAVAELFLVGPDNLARAPASAGPTWANFIISPNWPPGDYQVQGQPGPVLQVAKNNRNFQLPAPAQPLEVNFEGQLKLLGYDLPIRRVQPGGGIPITLYWQGLQWMSENFVIFNRLLDNKQTAWGGYDRLAQENYSTLFWAPGEVITDGFAIPVAPETPDGVYTISLGWYRPVKGEARSLFILDPETGQPAGQTSVTIGPIKVGRGPREVVVTQAAPQNQVKAMLGEQIELLGYDLDGRVAAELKKGESNSPLAVTLYWRALANPDLDYTVFVHLRNPAGEIVAQKDSPPAGGAYPTSLWEAGESIKDEIDIPLGQLKPGQYEVVVGMYDFKTGTRLPVAGSPDDTVRLWLFNFGQ